MLLKWLKERKARKAREDYLRGHKWATGFLRRGGSEDEIEDNVECSRSFGEYNGFDAGALDALETFREQVTSARPLLPGAYKLDGSTVTLQGTRAKRHLRLVQ